MNKKQAKEDEPTASSTELNQVSILEEIISHENVEYQKVPTSAKNAGNDSPAVPDRPFVGICIEPQHPTLMGRSLIQWDADNHIQERWLPLLHGMCIRKSDRVLVQPAINSVEPIVVGVVDGFKRRPDMQRNEVAALKLLRDESIIVTTEDGQKLIEIQRNESGPIVKLFQEDTQIDLPNKLRLTAKSIELTATQGDAKLSASDYVFINGEKIKLNS